MRDARCDRARPKADCGAFLLTNFGGYLLVGKDASGSDWAGSQTCELMTTAPSEPQVSSFLSDLQRRGQFVPGGALLAALAQDDAPLI